MKPHVVTWTEILIVIAAGLLLMGGAIFIGLALADWQARRRERKR